MRFLALRMVVSRGGGCGDVRCVTTRCTVLGPWPGAADISSGAFSLLTARPSAAELPLRGQQLPVDVDSFRGCEGERPGVTSALEATHAS